MALDSREKRANSLSVARPWLRDKFPNAAKDEAWRRSSGSSYGGNVLTPIVILQSFGERAAAPQRGLVADETGRGLVAKRSARGLEVEEFN